ncbi:ABC-three component system middle component 8 [Hahella chejuensis]
MVVLVRLKDLRIANYSDLLSYAKKSVIGGDVLFLPALNFLFLMGLIEYRQKTDSIEYTKNNETI